MVRGVQPEDLVEPLRLRVLRREETRRVITARLRFSHAPPGGAHVPLLDEDADGVEPPRVVRPHRAGDDEIKDLRRRANAQPRFGCDHRRTDVQGGPLVPRDPLPVEPHQGPEGGELVFDRDLRQAHARRRAVQTLRVPVGTEEADGAVPRVVRLHPLEDLLPVVQDHRGRGERQRPVRDDARVPPSLSRRVVHQEHVVREVDSEPEIFAAFRFPPPAGFRRLRNRDLHPLSLPAVPRVLFSPARGDRSAHGPYLYRKPVDPGRCAGSMIRPGGFPRMRHPGHRNPLGA